MRLQHKFCEYIPGEIKPGILYISMEFGTAVHLCCCGCGNKVITPFSPIDWKLIYDGETISLNPSIGNWSFDCQSHYWIKNNEIVIARKWKYEEIVANREHDKLKKEDYKKSKIRIAKSKNPITRIIDQFVRLLRL